MNNHPAPKAARNHLLFLDGLRGLAALYVVANHALLQILYNNSSEKMSRTLHHVTTLLTFGRMSVGVFIVLSGFCLMIPVARGDGSLRGGVLEFAKRRARRILPPYYAAMALSLLITAFVPGMLHPKNKIWIATLPAFTPSVIISHLFLVHNLSPRWINKIDFPMWSVATEWQIYFIFALALLPIWRRFGVAASVAAGFVLSFIPGVLFPRQFDGASFQFIGLFALGMAAASLAYAKSDALKAAAGWKVWGWMSGAAAIVYFILAGLRTQSAAPNPVPGDILVGVATTGLLLILTRQSLGLAPRSRAFELVVNVLEARPTAALGAFSYSLYLIHAPLLALMYFAILAFPMSLSTAFILSEAVGLPICVVGAYLFHRLFERPFMSERKPRLERPAEQEAVAATAP